MQLPSIVNLLYPTFLFRRRKKSKRITALRAEDAKLQAERRARLVKPAPHKAMPLKAKGPAQHTALTIPALTPAPVPVVVPQEVPTPAINEPSASLRGQPTPSRGTYANDFSSRRLATQLSRAEV